MMLSLETLSSHFTKLNAGDLCVWFSYATPIAYRYKGEAFKTSKTYSRSTTAHQWALGFPVVPPDEFADLLHNAWVRAALPPREEPAGLGGGTHA